MNYSPLSISEELSLTGKAFVLILNGLALECAGQVITEISERNVRYLGDVLLLVESRNDVT